MNTTEVKKKNLKKKFVFDHEAHYKRGRESYCGRVHRSEAKHKKIIKECGVVFLTFFPTVFQQIGNLGVIYSCCHRLSDTAMASDL